MKKTILILVVMFLLSLNIVFAGKCFFVDVFNLYNESTSIQGRIPPTYNTLDMYYRTAGGKGNTSIIDGEMVTTGNEYGSFRFGDVDNAKSIVNGTNTTTTGENLNFEFRMKQNISTTFLLGFEWNDGSYISFALAPATSSVLIGAPAYVSVADITDYYTGEHDWRLSYSQEARTLSVYVDDIFVNTTSIAPKIGFGENGTPAHLTLGVNAKMYDEYINLDNFLIYSGDDNSVCQGIGGYTGSSSCQYPCIWYEPFNYIFPLVDNDWYIYPINHTMAPKDEEGVINGSSAKWLYHHHPQIEEGIVSMKFNMSHQIDQNISNISSIFTYLSWQKWDEWSGELFHYLNLYFHNNDIKYSVQGKSQVLCTDCWDNNTDYKYRIEAFIRKPIISYYDYDAEEYKEYDKNTFRLYQNDILLGENLMFNRNFSGTDILYFNRVEFAKTINYTLVLDEIKIYVGTTEEYSDLNETLAPRIIVLEGNETICYGAFCQVGEEEAPFVNCDIVPECCRIIDGEQVAVPFCAIKFTFNYALGKIGDWIKGHWFYFAFIIFMIVLLVPLYLRYIKKHGE